MNEREIKQRLFDLNSKLYEDNYSIKIWEDLEFKESSVYHTAFDAWTKHLQVLKDEYDNTENLIREHKNKYPEYFI